MTNARADLLDAAERLLATQGRDALTTRRIAREARLNHGLVHYHFGAVDALVRSLADRCGERLVARRREAFAGDGPFLDRWRAAGRAMEDDLASGRARVWAELQAMAYADAALCDRVAATVRECRAILAEAFAGAAAEYGVSPAAVEPFVALVASFTTGVAGERLLGIEDGHRALMDWCDGMLSSLAEEAGAPG